MPHLTPLIGTMVAGLVLAFIFGAIAFRFRMPPLIGYLVAGIAVGPFTPGFVANQNLANELAEIGVILLMFGVGLHFSTRDLLAVWKMAVPGAIVQIAAATLLGLGLAEFMGWSFATGLVFGLALSVASTVVLLRALQERRILDTERGRIAVGWLIVEDLVMVLALVLIPVLATGGQGGSALLMTLLITVGKVVAFAAFMLIVGRRAVPWLLHVVAHSGSRELFRLAVLAVALGVALGAALLFGVSFALGAFFAGMILAESPLSQRAAEETLPLRDAFAVLFFVSVGMLFNPAVLFEAALPLVATVLIIMVGKSVAAFAIVRLFGKPTRTALTISASLAQIGEFSFILAALGDRLDLLPPQGRDLILAGAIISIMFNPLLFILLDRFGAETLSEADEPAIDGTPAPLPGGHIVLVGHGRVGKQVSSELIAAGERLVIIEMEPDKIGLVPGERLKLEIGNAASAAVLRRARIEDARILFVAIPDGFEGGQVVEQARSLNPSIRIVARAHLDEEAEHLHQHGADVTILGEREIARQMVNQALVGT
jgi:CPA2 family monovalent cation:H+ antiporter-2